MLLPTTASAVVIKRQPERGNDELRGDDDGKEVTGLVGRLAFRIGHDSGISPATREEVYDDDTRADKIGFESKAH
jgi:hypothetical protein